jgi:hypothetical protein
MRMRGTQEDRMELPGQIGVVLIPAFALQQPGVLEPRHRLTDPELDHREAPGSATCKS